MNYLMLICLLILIARLILILMMKELYSQIKKKLKLIKTLKKAKISMTLISIQKYSLTI